MRSGVRLSIGAVALVAGVAIFWTSISLWTWDQLYTPHALARSCIHQRDIAKLRQSPTGYLAFIVAHTGHSPPHLRDRVAAALVHRFGFLFVPLGEQQHLVETMRICGTAPKVS